MMILDARGANSQHHFGSMNDVLSAFITGANGFVASHLIPVLSENCTAVTGSTRSRTAASSLANVNLIQSDLLHAEELESALEDISVVIHLASRVHCPQDQNDLDAYRAANVLTTKNLLQAAVKNRVKRFIYISTIKVNGEMTAPGEGYTANMTVSPQGAYAQSKHEAEQLLIEECKKNNMEYVILRPPLIYGPGVRANFLKLLQLIIKGVPLPTRTVKNRRSMIFVRNFVDIIFQCIVNEQVKNQTFVVCDHSVSTRELIRELAHQSNMKYREFPLPLDLMEACLQPLGKAGLIRRINQSLFIDDSEFRQASGWQPVFSFPEAIKETTDWFLQNNHNA